MSPPKEPTTEERCLFAEAEEREQARIQEAERELVARKRIFVYELDALCRKYGVEITDGGYENFTFNLADPSYAGSEVREEHI
jgi:hypothetical protein